MNCSNCREIIDQKFDAGALEKMPPDCRDHIERCDVCRAYFAKLASLDASLEDFESPPLKALYLAKVEEKLRRKATEGAGVRRGYQRPIVAAIAIMLMAILLFQDKFSDRATRPGDIAAEMKFYSAKIQATDAGAILFKPAEAGEPVIVWLYEN